MVSALSHLPFPEYITIQIKYNLFAYIIFGGP